MNKVIHGDNMEYMKTIPDNYFDLGIIDPAYGIKAASNQKTSNLAIAKNYGKKDWDDKPPSEEFFNEVKRVSKNYIIFGANYFESLVGETFKPIKRDQIKDFCIKNDNWIIWDKCNGTNDFNDTEMALHNFNGCSIIFKYMWAGMLQGKSISQGHIMQGNKKLNEKRIHPTQKPVILYKWILQQFAKPGDKIGDTGVGSGSLRIACYDMGFDFEGCENNIEIYNDQEARFKKHIQQGDLFSGIELQKSIYP